MEEQMEASVNSTVESLRARVATLEADCANERAANQRAQESLRTLFEYHPAAVVMLDVESGRFVGVNSNAEQLFGLSRARLLEVGPFDLSPEFQPDGPSLELGRQRIKEALSGGAPVFEWWHCNARGERFPCEITLIKMPWGESDVLRAAIFDISARKQLELTEHGRRHVLETIARGAPLDEVLDGLAHTVERLLPGMIASILTLDEKRSCLRCAAAPNLPDFYNSACDGLAIGPDVGSCGAAAFTGQRVIVSDVMRHPYWIEYRSLAERANLRSCWSEPVISLGGKVLGTFAMYDREPREPTPLEIRVIEVAAHLAAIAIEHDRTQQTLRTMNEALEIQVVQQAQQLDHANLDLSAAQTDVRLAAVAFQTHDSILITATNGKILRVNPSFTRMTGYTAEEVVGETPRILKSGRHDDEFYRQMWAAIRTRGFWQGEIWNRRKNGQVYPQRLTISCVKDASGRTTHYVADGQDLTEEKRAEADRAAMEVARQIQQALFPDAAPVLTGFDIAGTACPAERVGGDYFDYLRLGRTSVGVVVADVSGHGVGPALLMAQTQACLRALAESHDDPGEIMTRAHRLSRLGGEGRFATLFLGRFDLKERTFVHAAAGHQGFLVNRGGKATTLKSTGLPLGLPECETIQSAEAIQLQSGDVIVIPTDGVFEARNPSDELFGVGRTLDVVRAHMERSAAEIVQSVFDAARAFSEGRQQEDDVTMIVVKVQ